MGKYTLTKHNLVRKEMFAKQLIHSLDEIQKFHFLKSSLKGKATEFIDSLEITAENCEDAWILLCKHFDNYR